jgi:hypothetical protein
LHDGLNCMSSRSNSAIKSELRRAMLLPAPRHVDAHRNLILDRNCKQRCSIDLEIRTRGGNGPCNMHHVALLGPLKLHMTVMGSLAHAGQTRQQNNIRRTASCRSTCASPDQREEVSKSILMTRSDKKGMLAQTPTAHQVFVRLGSCAALPNKNKKRCRPSFADTPTFTPILPLSSELLGATCAHFFSLVYSAIGHNWFSPRARCLWFMHEVLKQRAIVDHRTPQILGACLPPRLASSDFVSRAVVLRHNRVIP